MAQLPIVDFLTERLAEYDPTFELRPGTGFHQLFFKPLQFIVQPLRDEADDLRVAQSFKRILETEDPNSFSEEAVDALAANLFVERVTGSRSTGVVRVYYDSPVAREYPATGATFVGNNSQNYSNPSPFAISQAQMSSQIEGDLYYYDIPVQSESIGGDTSLDSGGIVSLLNDDEVITVTNPLPISGGIARETNTELIDRVRNSIAVRDLVVGKGFNAILFENFAGQITELQAVGLGDPEMMRDILFNTHVGGKVDGYFKTPNIQIKTMNFIGLLIDSTRQTDTKTNVVLTGDLPVSLGTPNIDRSNNRTPIVKEVKSEEPAEYVGTINLAGGVNLASDARVNLTIGGVVREVPIAGPIPSVTTRPEIINKINVAFGATVAFLRLVSGQERLMLRTTGVGVSQQIIVNAVGSGTQSAHLILDPGLTTFPELLAEGDGPIIFTEDQDYTLNDGNGTITRIPPPLFSGFSIPQPNGVSTAGSNVFKDSTPTIFSSVVAGHILRIVDGTADDGDYRILAVDSGAGELILDSELELGNSGVDYQITEPGIKNDELVAVEYSFNPLSIDVGNLVKLDPDGKIRGIRPGREDYTIPDTAFLRITRVEVIDPVTSEPLGIILEGRSGYGRGGYGRGGYGVGESADYTLVVNEPTERYSAFEDSYIVFSAGFQGLSLQVEYEYVPEVVPLHNFVRSENERVLDGDILMKHFIPAYVAGTINYRVDNDDVSIPDNDALTELVKDYINTIKAGQPLEYSDLKQYIYSVTDPFRRYGTFIRDFKLTAEIHNVDGTTNIISTVDQLEMPTLDPFPKFTTRPLSPRITHWIAGDIVLVRE